MPKHVNRTTLVVVLAAAIVLFGANAVLLARLEALEQNFLLWYAIPQILGPGGIVLPLTDLSPLGDGFNSDTFTTVGATQAVVTWTEAPNQFDSLRF